MAGGCGGNGAPEAAGATELSAGDPLAAAWSGRAVANVEAAVPPQCYTRTEARANPCYVCHVVPRDPNHRLDVELQQEYAFSSYALENHWTNLFADRRPAIAAISDAEALRWIREDNYGPLRQALAQARDWPGYRPDLDLDAGFDDEGFARDGSGWRAVRYVPFPGAFWPSNGSSGDVFLRLPARFRCDASGAPSRPIYRLNLAILEAALCADPRAADEALQRAVEPVDESLAGNDLDGDGQIGGSVACIAGLPRHYAGGAADEPVRRYLYPQGTEFLHTLRYLDPEQPQLLSRRLKELRYMRKTEAPDTWALLRAEEKEHDEKDEGVPPSYAGAPDVGLLNPYGWQIQGFIEDPQGRLRLQTEEEHRSCMGCHGGLGVTADSTFSFSRKLPGAAGWRHQDLRGMSDLPQAGHAEPEALEYFRRAGGGDELRANEELQTRFFREGRPIEAELRRAAPGGDRDLAWLLAPTPARSLLLDKAYMALVREQSYTRGRMALPAPAQNVHPRIENGSTGLAEAGQVYGDGTLWLDWSAWRP